MPAEVRETSLKTGFMSLDVILLAFVEIFTSFLFILFYIYIFFFQIKMELGEFWKAQSF